MKYTLAAEYVLGTLQGFARKGFERRLQKDKSLQREVSLWEGYFSDLANDIDPVTPSEAVYRAIESRMLLSTPNVVQLSLWNRVGTWRGLALAASVALVLLLNKTKPGESLTTNSFAPTSLSVSIIQDKQNKPLWLIQITADHKKISIRPLQTVAVKEDQSLELWMLPGSGAPISLGVLPLEQTVTFNLNEKQVQAYNDTQGLAVSLEPKNGSPTGAPTGPVLFTAAIVHTT